MGPNPFIFLAIILIALVICIVVSIKIVKSQQSNWWILAVFVIYYFCFHSTIGALIIGLGYYIDPTGWGENNALAMFLIKLGGLIM